ncbi:MAG: insulinase family protein [Clostridiales bacterium]|nr:insulinase family protein [Clostridiales bacterium]
MFDSITLSNGLRVVGEQLNHLRSCSVGVWIKAGSMNEKAGENGLSHFIEHMVFKGTANRTARQIAEQMDAVGGQLNAFTGKDCTCYYAKVIDEYLPLAVDMLSDLSLHPRFTEDDLRRESGVIMDEIAMVEDSPEDLVNEVLAEAQFTGSLKRPVLGTADLISKYTVGDIRGYWRRHYQPENIVIAIAGKYDWDAFLALVDQYFDQFPEANGVPETKPQAFLGGRLFRDKDVEQVQLCIGYRGYALGTDELYALSMFSNALGGGMSSRLFQRIREELGLAYSVYSYPGSYPAIGTFTVYAGTSPGNAETVIREMQEQMKTALQQGFSDDEFESAKAQLKGAFLLGLESSSGRMQSIGRSMLHLNRLRTTDEVLSKIEAVTKIALHDAAEYVLNSPSSAAVVGKDAQRILRFIR